MSRWWPPSRWFRAERPVSRRGRLFFRGFAWKTVDRVVWHGWDGALGEPHNDIVAMRARLRADDAAVLFDREATVAACEQAVRALWLVARDGDDVIVDISGHGGDDLPGDASEPRSEYVCAWDGPWPEWQIQALARGFALGVRVLFIIDTCNSRGFAKDRPLAPFAEFAARMPLPKVVPPEVAALISNTHASLFRAIRAAKKAGLPKPSGTEPPAAVLSAAEEGTPAYDGVFHRELVAALAPGQYWRGVLHTTQRRIGSQQRPNFDAITEAGEMLLDAVVPL